MKKPLISKNRRRLEGAQSRCLVLPPQYSAPEEYYERWGPGEGRDPYLYPPDINMRNWLTSGTGRHEACCALRAATIWPAGALVAILRSFIASCTDFRRAAIAQLMVYQVIRSPATCPYRDLEKKAIRPTENRSSSSGGHINMPEINVPCGILRGSGSGDFSSSQLAIHAGYQ